MGSFANFAGLNLQDDILNPRTARSVLRLIEGLRQQIIDLGIENLFTTFAAHSVNTANPHKLTFDDFPAELIAALYKSYAALPNSTMTEAAFTTFVQQNPPVLFELIRRLVLNSYSYIDGYGAAPSGDSYDASDLVVDDTPAYPAYHAGANCLDLRLTPATFMNQSLISRSVPAISGNLGIIGSTTGSSYNNVLYLNSSEASNTVMVQISGTTVTVQTYMSGAASGIISVSGTTNFPRGVISSYSPVTLNGSVAKFGCVLTSGLLVIYIQYSDLDVDKISFIMPATFMGVSFDTLYLSEKGFQNRLNGDTDGFKSLSLYAQALTDEEVNFLFETL